MRSVWLQLAVFMQLLPAQQATIPVVGCESDGQVGPRSAPKSDIKSVNIGTKTARRLAYYKTDLAVVLAPRGWYCFGGYGSGGDSLLVSPKPIDRASRSSLEGPVIYLSHRYGGTSGRLGVAAVIARVFPARKSFIADVRKAEPELTFPSGPYPKDSLKYINSTTVEYKTPPQTEGLGTFSLSAGALTTRGVAILIGSAPDLLLLSVRLPSDMTNLSQTVIRHVEIDAPEIGRF